MHSDSNQVDQLLGAARAAFDERIVDHVEEDRQLWRDRKLRAHRALRRALGDDAADAVPVDSWAPAPGSLATWAPLTAELGPIGLSHVLDPDRPDSDGQLHAITYRGRRIQAVELRELADLGSVLRVGAVIDSADRHGA